jgi:hypothetical protein
MNEKEMQNIRLTLTVTRPGWQKSLVANERPASLGRMCHDSPALGRFS